MCEKCKDGGCLIEHTFESTRGELFTRLRFDADNNQLDMQYGAWREESPIDAETEWSHGIDIAFCPFCGQRIPVEVPIEEFISMIKPDEQVVPGSDVDEIVNFMIKQGTSNFDTNNIEMLRVLTRYYNTEVIAVKKIDNVIHVFFKEPDPKHLERVR